MAHGLPVDSLAFRVHPAFLSLFLLLPVHPVGLSDILPVRHLPFLYPATTGKAFPRRACHRSLPRMKSAGSWSSKRLSLLTVTSAPFLLPSSGLCPLHPLFTPEVPPQALALL